jgi:hypothetical protein
MRMFTSSSSEMTKYDDRKWRPVAFSSLTIVVLVYFSSKSVKNGLIQLFMRKVKNTISKVFLCKAPGPGNELPAILVSVMSLNI